MVRKVSRTSAVCALKAGGRVSESGELGWTPGGDLGDGGGVDAGVLADVEGLEVQAVGADLDQQRIDEHLGEARAAVVDQRVAEGGEIGEELGGAGVGLERGVCWNRNGGLRSGSEAHHDAGDEQADGFVGEALAESVLAGGAELSEVAVEQGGQFGGDGHLLGGAGELLEDILQAAAVVGEQERVGHREGFARGLRGDEGIAVAVAADPGAEADELGKIGDAGSRGGS